MKNAVSTVELVFVMVVLSILAAVSIPKLAQEKTKGTAFEEIAKVGAEIRKELNNQIPKNTVKTKVFSEEDIKKVIVEKEMYKQKFLDQKLKYTMCTEQNKLDKVNKLDELKSVNEDIYSTQGTGY